ncbi:MAG: hypothetical protein ABF824_15225 [Acetobacter sp.]
MLIAAIYHTTVNVTAPLEDIIFRGGRNQTKRPKSSDEAGEA